MIYWMLMVLYVLNCFSIGWCIPSARYGDRWAGRTLVLSLCSAIACLVAAEYV